MSKAIIADLRRQMAEAEAAVRKVQAEMRDKGRKALEPAFLEFFAANPEVEAIRWAQYTPYFNDGDECVFRVREFCVEFTKEFRSKHMKSDFDPECADDEKWYEGDAWYVSKESVEGQGALARFKAFVNDVKDTELLKAVFGDHVRIEATRNGLSVRDYDHE